MICMFVLNFEAVSHFGLRDRKPSGKLGVESGLVH